jgi:hypothetical protein
MRKAWLLALGLWGCNDRCYRTDQLNYTHYSFQATAKSPRYGFEIDDPKSELDLGQLDDLTARVAACVQRVGPPTDDEKKLGDCSGDFQPEIKPCLRVKVTPNWAISPCSGEQIFPCDVPQQSCTNKGLQPNPACPCSCRAIIQDDTMVVVTPNLRIYAGQLSTLLTGCTNSWTGRLVECAKLQADTRYK